MTDALPASTKSAYSRLPRRYRRFVDEYVTGKSGTDSILAAGCKSQHARTVASRLLRKPDIQAALEERTREVVADAGVRHERVVRELYAIATLDPRNVVDPETGIAVPLERMDAATAAAISSVEVENISINGETGTRYKYRFWDKGKALDKLGQYLKLWDAARTHVNVDARSVTVHGADSDAVRRVDEFVRRIATQGGAAASGANGPVLPAPLCDGAGGRGSPVDADPHPGSAGNP